MGIGSKEIADGLFLPLETRESRHNNSSITVKGVFICAFVLHHAGVSQHLFPSWGIPTESAESP